MNKIRYAAAAVRILRNQIPNIRIDQVVVWTLAYEFRWDNVPAPNGGTTVSGP